MRIEPGRVFSGWKDIANYLGKGVRTVQRYERFMGLPVRRPAGKPRASVVATRVELDAWVAASPIREAFQLTKPRPDSNYLAAAAAIKKGVAEMKQLREQMVALRVDVTTYVHLLRESVRCLDGEVRRQPLRNNDRLTVSDLGGLAPEHLRANVFGLLDPQKGGRKVS
jgi:hypothetical protein